MVANSYGTRSRNGFLMDNVEPEIAEEALRNLTCSELPTFPERALPEVGQLRLDVSWLAQYKLKLDNVYKNSPYYLLLPPRRRFVERYGDKFAKRDKNMGKTLANYCPYDIRYFPEELKAALDPKFSINNHASDDSNITGKTKPENKDNDFSNVRQLLEEAEKYDKTAEKGAPIVANEDERVGEYLEQEEDDFDEDLEGEYIQDFYDEDFDPFADNDETTEI